MHGKKTSFILVNLLTTSSSIMSTISTAGWLSSSLGVSQIFVSLREKKNIFVTGNLVKYFEYYIFLSDSTHKKTPIKRNTLFKCNKHSQIFLQPVVFHNLNHKLVFYFGSASLVILSLAFNFVIYLLYYHGNNMGEKAKERGWPLSLGFPKLGGQLGFDTSKQPIFTAPSQSIITMFSTHVLCRR